MKRSRKLTRAVLTGSILACAGCIIPDAYGQFYVGQFNGGAGANNADGEFSNRTLSIFAGGFYNQADFTDDNSGHGGTFTINNLIPGDRPGQTLGDNEEQYSILGSGILHVLTTGTYTFKSNTDDAARITIDGRNVQARDGCCNENAGPGIVLQANSTHFIQVSYREGGGGSGGDFYVSRDGGANGLLGVIGQPSVHADLTVDQAGGFTLAGAAGQVPGLLGRYYIQPGGVTQNFATDQFLATLPAAVGTFTSTGVNYTVAGNVATHLGADGATLTAGGTNDTGDALFKFDGFVQVTAGDDLDLVTPGVQVKFVLDADDNARLTLGGLVIMENDGGHGTNHFATNNTNQLFENAGDNAGGTALVNLPSPGLYSLSAQYHNGSGAGNGLAGLLYSSLGLATGNVQILPGSRLFQQVAPPGGPRFWSVGAGTGSWENGGPLNWRITNDNGPGNAAFGVDDTANFGDLNAAGARTVTVTGTVVPNQTFVTNAAGNDYTIGGGTGVIGGFGNLTKDGAGKLTIGGDNTFAGNVFIKHGEVSAGSIGDTATAGNLGKGATITLGDTTGANDAKLTYTGSTATTARALIVQSNGGEIAASTAGETITFGGALSGSGTISKTGPGGVSFSAPSGSFSGGITVSGGSLAVTAFASGTGNVALSSGGTFNYAGNTFSDGRSLVTGAGGGTMTVSNSLARYQVASANNTGGPLTVSGPGRLAVTGVANFPTLPTLTANGTLALLNEGGGNTLPATLAVSTGTLELANNAFTAGTPLQLDGGTIRLGHEGLQGYYFSGVYDQGAWQASMSGTASTVRGAFELLGAPATAARSNTGGQTNLDWNNGNGSAAAPFSNQGFAATDDIRSVWIGKILITNPGLTTFFTTSDDGSGIFIDGQRVVDNNFFQGMTERSGSINLSAGLHDIGVYFYEGGGGAGLIAQYTPQGGTKQVIPNSVLFAGDTYNASTSPVIVNQDSNLEIGADAAALGAMTINANKTLSIVGSANFAGTVLAAAGASGVNVQNFEGSVNLGPVSGLGTTINKGGPGALVFSATTAGLTLNNNAGLVVLQGDGVTNPLAASTINFLGGGLGFSATAGNPTYVSNVVAGTNSYRIEAGRFGGTLATSNVTWDPANNNIAVGTGATATFNVRNVGWTLAVSAPTSGPGAVEVEEGPITFNDTIGNAGGFTVKGANVTANAPINTGAISLTGSHGNVTTLNPVLTAQDTINATSINVTRGTLNANDTTTNTGAFTQAGGTANFNVGSSHASGAVSGGTANFIGPVTVTGVLTASGNGTLNIRNNATTGATNINTATVNLDMGAGNTRTYNGPINVNNGTLRAQSGTTDLGTNALTGATTYQAGLQEGVFMLTNNINATTANPGTGHPNSATGGIQLSPRLGLTGRTSDNTDYGNNTNGDNNYWKQNETWVYTGQFFDADGVFTFAENIDDNVSVRIDGVQVIKNDTEDSWRTITNSASASGQRFDNSAGLTVNSGTPNVSNNYGPGAEGWHTIDIRFSNGGGGAGAVGDGSVGQHSWGGGDNNAYTRKGFGLNVNGTTSFEGDQYILPIDPGDGSLFRVALASSAVNIDAGADLRAGSTTGTTAINLNGQSGNPATFRLNNNGALTNSTANRVLVGTGGTPNGALVVGTNNVFTVGKLGIPAGGSLDVSGPGTLVVSGSVAGSVAAVTTVIDGSLNLNGPGVVRINSSVGTSVGTTTLNGGTLGGTGTLAGVVVNGGFLAPGESAGTLTMSSLSLTSGSTIQLELALAGTPGGTNDLLQVNGALTLDGVLQVIELPGFTDGTYRIANYTGALTNNTLNLQPGFLALHPGSFVSVATANQINLVVIPEPGSLAALLGGMGVLTGLRRFRRRA